MQKVGLNSEARRYNICPNGCVLAACILVAPILKISTAQSISCHEMVVILFVNCSNNKRQNNGEYSLYQIIWQHWALMWYLISRAPLSKLLDYHSRK